MRQPGHVLLHLALLWLLAFAIPPTLASPLFGRAPAVSAEEQDESDASATEADTENDSANDEKKSNDAESDDSSDTSADSEQTKGEEKKSAPEKEEKKSEEASASAEAESDAKSEKKESSEKKAKRKTHKVEPKRLKIDVTVDGTFVAKQMEEVALRPEVWSDFEIVEVVDHGERVHKGQVLVRFDDDKIDEAIADLELDQRISELAILTAEEELPRVEKTLELDLALAERLARQAEEDAERYKEIDRPMMIKTAEFMVKYYNFMLNYEKDELEQLEKMYEADDLTEETEEIILKRQRNSVEFAEFSLENATINRDETLNVNLPRYDARIKEGLERTALALARAQMASNYDLRRARYTLEKSKKARRQSLEKHEKLLKDRGLMEIKSPADGIVFYGQQVNGRWSDTTSLISKYKPHSKMSPGSVLMTIVEPRPVYVTAALDEAERPHLEDGQQARIALPAEGSDRIDGKVESISTIPVSTGKFQIEFEVTGDDIPEWVVPGISCKVSVVTYDKKDAIVIPKAAIQTDEDDDEKKYVWIVDSDDEDAKPQRRDVELGRRKGDEVEIVKGLKKGDVISLENEDAKAKKAE